GHGDAATAPSVDSTAGTVRRPDLRDHVPRARRRGLRVHLRLGVGLRFYSADRWRAASLNRRRRRPVLLVADVVTPRRRVAFVVDLEHRKVGHDAVPRGPVPASLAPLEEAAVAGPDRPGRSGTGFCECGAAA